MDQHFERYNSITGQSEYLSHDHAQQKEEVVKNGRQAAYIVLTIVGIFFIFGLWNIFSQFSTSLKTNSNTPLEPSTLRATAPVAPEKTVEPETPLRVQVPSQGIDIQINHPGVTDVAILDESLLTGAVHYPGSGLLREDRNMLLFGHSSYLPVVNNEVFKAFNGLQDLKPGDEIIVSSEDREYLYKVDDVAKKKASEAAIDLRSDEPKLTLSTCNSFGSKDDRFIVEAYFVTDYKKVPTDEDA